MGSQARSLVSGEGVCFIIFGPLVVRYGKIKMGEKEGCFSKAGSVSSVLDIQGFYDP